MKVIKRGNLPEDQVFIVTCRRCTSVLEFKKSEAKSSCHRNEITFAVNCPVCLHDVWMDKLVPVGEVVNGSD